MILSIGSHAIPIRLEQTKGQKYTLRPGLTGAFIRLLSPKGTYSKHAQQLVEANQAWLVQQFQQLQTREARRNQWKQQILDGQLLFMGKDQSLKFIAGNTAKVQREAAGFSISVPPAENTPQGRSHLTYQAIRVLASQELSKRTRELAQATDSQPKRIVAKAQLSRWGSCSGKANINLNAHLAFLPRQHIDYVIIHELMHLREMNHSPRFWKWVATYCPDYQKLRRELQTHGWLIGTLNGWKESFIR